MDQILAFIGVVLTVVAVVIVGALAAVAVVIIIVVDLILKGLAALYPIVLKVLATLAPVALTLLALYIVGIVIVCLYNLVAYLVDTIIINPTQNYCNKDLSFLYKNKTISIFKYLFMTRFDRGQIIKYMRSDTIKGFFKERRISLHNVMELEKKEQYWTDINDLFKNFKDNNINHLFLKNKLTFKQAVYASSDTCKSLQSEFIIKAFENDEIDFDTIENRKKFSSEAIDALSNSYIMSLLKEHSLNLETYLSLNQNTIEALQVENIYNLYKEEKITIDDLKNNTVNVISALNNKNIYELFKNNHITLENLQKCRPNAKKALCQDCIATMYKNGKINLEELNTIIDTSISFLSDETCAQLLLDEHITFSQIQSLKSIEKLTKKLTSAQNYQLLTNKRITFVQLNELNQNALDFIFNDKESDLSRKVSDEEFKVLENLSSDNIAQLFNKKRITFSQFKSLTPNIINALKKDYIFKFFNTEQITFDHLKEYTLEDLKSLENTSIQQLFDTSKLSIDNIKQCSHDDFFQDLLTIPFVKDSILHHGNTFEDLLKIKHYDMSMHTTAIKGNFLEQLRRLSHVDRFPKKPFILNNFIKNFNEQVETLLIEPSNINLPQSSHTNSTEEAFSSFVIKLKERYISPQSVKGFIFDQNHNLQLLLIKHRKHSISKLEDLDKEKVFIQVLCHFGKTKYLEKKSDSSLKMLLALTYKTACDNQLDLEEYAKLMYEAFFEIRRGGNINNNAGVDDGQEDKNICPRGAFNKILEKMVGFLPGCEMIVVTPESVTQKLIALLRGKIKAFVQGNIQELLTMHIDNRKNYIFDSIQDETLNELKEEFGEKNAKPGIDNYSVYKEYSDELIDLISEEINKHPQEPPIQRLEENGLFENHDNNDDDASEAWMASYGVD
ncbi:MAG: hypothetical protein P8L77_01435 [Gammaproteobacteria bacterium]|nr:hypothetical protein [Gammaproteobacteria bacterium]